MQLRTLQDWVVRPRLLRVQGVADVVSYGGLVREVHVQPVAGAAGRLRARRCEELENALEKASQNASGGILERGAEQLVIRSQGLFSTLRRHRASCAVATRDGTPVLVRDVATVSDGWAPRQGVVSRGARLRHGRGHRAHAPRRESLRGAGAACAPRSPSSTRACFPRASRSMPFYDRTDLVDTTLHTVGHNLLEGARAGDAGAVRLPARPARRAHRRRAHPAVAAVGVHLPASCAA